MNRFFLPIETSHGTFLAHYSEKGLSELDFPHAKATVKYSTEMPTQVREWHAQTIAALQAALAGKSVELPPLDATGTDFQKSVWAVMQKIKAGETMSYGDLAAQLGKPGAARAVGAACGANPIPVLVPCHRVLASHGKIGGFSGGLDWKKKLLKIEGLKFDGQQETFSF